MINRTGKKYLNELRDLKAALNQTAIVAVSDADGTILDVNDKFCKISKYTRHELIGKNYRIINSGFHSAEFMKKLWRTIRRGKVWHDLIKNRAGDGSYYWVDTTIVPFLDDAGQPVRYISLQHDVTRQKLSEERLAANLEELRVLEEELSAQNEELLFSRELLSKAFAASPDALLISRSLDWQIIDINESGTKLFGYSRSQLIGQTPNSINLFVDPLEIHRVREILKKKNRIRDFETQIRNSSGESRDIALSIEKLMVDGKKRFLTVIKDETARKQAETKLRDSEQQMRLVLNATCIGIWIYDIVADRTFWSPDNCRIFGIETFDGGNETFWNMVDERDRDRIYEKFHEAINQRCFYDVEYRINRKDGESRWVKGLGHCEYDAEGRPIRFFGASLDITAEKLAAEKLRESEERLQIAVEVANFAICEIDYRNDTVHLTKEAAALFDLGAAPVSVPRGLLYGMSHPEDAARVSELIRSALDVTGDGWFAGEYRIVRSSGETRWLSVRQKVFFDETENPPRPVKAILAAHDISERKRREEKLSFLTEIATLFEKLSGTEEIMHSVSEKVGEFLNISNCLFTDIDELLDTAHVAYSWNAPGMPDVRGTYRLSTFIDDDFRRAARRGATVVVNDTQADPRTAAAYAKFQIHSFVTIPFQRSGEWKYSFTVNDRIARRWREDEIELIKEITSLVYPRLERSRAESALRDSQQRFEQIANSLPQLVWTCLADGRCEFLSRQWVEYTGVPEHEQLGYGWLRQLHPDDRKPTIQAWHRAVAEGTTFNVEYRIRRHDGAYRSFDTRAVPLYDADFEIVKWFGSNTDITERKQALESLAASEQRYRSLFETSRDGIVTVDMNGYILEANPAYQAMLGYSMEELRMLKYQQLTPLCWREKEESIVRNRILPKGDSGEYEKEYISKNGTIFPVSARTWTVHDAQGHVIGMQAHVRDITERKKTEQLIEEKNQLLEQSYDAIFICNIEDDIIYWHPNAERLYGFTEREALGRDSHEMLKTVYPKPFQEFAAELKEKGYWEGELIHTTKPGTEVVAEARMHVIRRDERNLIVLQTLRDVTERRQTEAKLARAAQLALVGEFAAGLAHEIKNPLAGIKGVIDILLQQREWEQGEDREILESVRYEIERIDKTVRALLQHSRPKPLEIKPAPLNETVRRAAQFAALQKNNGHPRREKTPIQLDLPDTPLVVAHDSAGIEGAVLNLILNARDAIEGIATGVIFVRLKKSEGSDNDEALIEVEDNGVGIASERLDKIFTPFQTSKSEGTGLGLASVRRIVRAHGGDCKVRSKVGMGTTFTIHLPLESAANLPGETLESSSAAGFGHIA